MSFLNKFKTLHEEILPPAKFLKLNGRELANISYTEIVPPVLGTKDFGAIKVHYKIPKYMNTNIG